MADLDPREIIGRAEGSTPRPEFLATLRDRIEREALAQSDGTGTAPTDASVIEPVLHRDDRNTKTMSKNKMLALAAAAAALLAIVGLAIWAGGDGPSETDTVDQPDGDEEGQPPESTTTTTEPEPELTTPPSDTDGEAVADPWEALPVWSGLQWGEVRTEGFAPALSFVVPEGIGKTCTTGQAGLDFVPEGVGPAAARRMNTARMVVMRLSPSTVDETVAAIAAESVTTSEPSPISIDGAAGVSFDAQAAARDNSAASILDEVDCGLNFGEVDWQYRFWVVDVDGQIVTFGLFASDGRIDEYDATLTPVLDSIAWRGEQ